MNANLPLGKIVMTRNAQDKLQPEDVNSSLRRHAGCDWGEVCDEDRNANDRALAEGFRLLSVYQDRAKTKFWIITEADRSVTTVLLPEDY